MTTQFNVLGTPLEACSNKPKTGFFRDGSCATNTQDVGNHTVCAMVDDRFLAYSREQGNDLVTPVPQFDFPGLKAGDKWCLCAARWKEAYDAGVAPPVVLHATHARATEVIELDTLLAFAVDLPSHS